MSDEDRDNESIESSQSPPLCNNTTFHPFDNLGHTSNNHNTNDTITVQNFDLQRLQIEQGNTMMALKMIEYEKALIEKDFTIQSLHTDMMNFQSNNYVLTNQHKVIMEKTNSVSETCLHFNTSFTNICDRLNRLGVTADNVKTRQKEIKDLVDQTTKKFQDKIVGISESIEKSLSRVIAEKVKIKEELDAVTNKYSLDLIACKTSTEKLTKELENIKFENLFLLDELNEASIKLDTEREITFNLNQNYDKELKEMECQNVQLVKNNMSLNANCETIQNENKSLKEQLTTMKNSLNENKQQLAAQLSLIKEQTDVLDMLKMSEELNDSLKARNFTLNERNEYLEKMNKDLVNDVGNIKVSEAKIQEEVENKYKDLCANYDNLLKILEEKLTDSAKKLELQKDKESKFQDEIINLKQEIEQCNNVKCKLQEEGEENLILVPKLQSKIDDLNTVLENTYEKLRNSSKTHLIEKNELEKEKYELELQSKEHFEQIEKLTSNYMKYKSKAKQLYVEVMRLRYLSKRSGQKTTQNSQPLETIEIKSDDEENNKENDDVSIVEFSDTNVSMRSNSSKVNKKNIHSNSKRRLSPLQSSSKLKGKKRKTMNDAKAYQENIDINQSTRDNNVQNNTTLSSQIENVHVNNLNRSQVVNSNISSSSGQKMKFKIPPDMKPSQKKTKTNVQKKVFPQPNSPVPFIPISPKQNMSSTFKMAEK